MDKYDKFVNNSEAPTKYSSDNRFNDLIKDPAHAGGPKEITLRTRQEAMAALEAEAQGYVKKPISRGTAEIDFIDGDGIPWDVKAPPLTQYFDQLLLGMIEKFKSEISKGRKVLLDCTYMNEADLNKLRNLMNQTMNSSELRKVIEINSIF